MVGKILVTAHDMAEGEVRRIDKAAGRITLKQGEIRSIDMPPMTMVFGVRDKAVLDKLKSGDKVRFSAVNEAGSCTVTEIEVVPWPPARGARQRQLPMRPPSSFVIITVAERGRAVAPPAP